LRAELGALAALIALAGCSHASARTPSVPPAATSAVARIPAWSDRAVRSLQSRLSEITNVSALATSGIAVVDAAGRPLFERQARHAFAPASTFKLLAATTALATFGPGYRFATDLRAVAPPTDGVVHGDVWLVGSGDPTLTGDDLRAAAGALARAGVHAIDGALVADASAFGGREVNPAWEPDDLQYDYAAGTSALSIDGGTVEFHLVPQRYGAPVRIEVRPNAAGVTIRGGVTTGGATSLSIDRAPDENVFDFDGRVAVGAEQSFWRPVAHQPRYVARVFAAMLAERGIDVRDGIREGTAPLGGVSLWLHRSAPLRDIERDMLFTSNNHDAETLLRAVGAEHTVGTERTGGLVEQTLLRALDVPTAGLRIVDGSGLAPSDRVAPLSLATLLARAAGLPIGPALIADLPRVGIEGTVRYRSLTDAYGKVRAKSGHIGGVNALAGYVQTRTHGRVAFAFIVNDVRADDGRVDRGIDQALDLLARE
jgi:D-alanyl-D-alanine carboxypeptidase/D-alanyl-D-alanine-endopeptidase (penicillin-binding protein 4)